MHFLLTLCAAVGVARAQIGGDRLARFFLGHDRTARRPPSWAAELRHMDARQARQVYAEMVALAEVRRAAEVGRQYKMKSVDRLSKALREDVDILEKFRQFQLEPFLAAQKRLGPERRLIDAERAASSRLNVSDPRVIQDPEWVDLRRRWQRVVQLELLRPDRTGSAQGLPRRPMIEWRSAAAETLQRSLARLIGSFLTHWQSHLLVVVVEADPPKVMMLKDAVDAGYRISFDDENDGIDQWTAFGPEGEEGHIVWIPNQCTLNVNGAMPLFLDVADLAQTGSMIKGEMALQRLRHLVALRRWVTRLADDQTPEGLRAQFASLRSVVETTHPSIEQLLEIHETAGGFSPYHTPELARLLVDLNYALLVERPNFWSEPGSADEDRPVVSLRTGAAARRESRNRRGRPPPAPIEEYDSKPLFDVRAEDGPAPKVFRWQTPLDGDDDWDDASVEASPRAPLVLSTRRGLKARRRWIAVPTPLDRDLAELSLSLGGEALSSESFRVVRSRRSRAYAVELREATRRVLGMKVAFGPRSERARTEIPPISDHLWRDLGAEFASSGESRLSRSLALSLPADPRRLSAMVKSQTFYTYHPASERAVGRGAFGMLAPFLDEEGTLCIQCSHASEQLLDPMLRLGYRDRPEFASRARTFLLRSGNHLTWPAHAAVEIFWKGELVDHLDPNPGALDPRAPTRHHRDRARSVENQRRLVEDLARLQGEIGRRSLGQMPRGLPDDSPLHRLWQMTTAARAGEIPAAASVVEELDRLMRWSRTEEKMPPNFAAIRTYLRSVEMDLGRLGGLLIRLGEDASCDSRLSK